MSDTKISSLTSYTTPLAADLFPIVDTANTTTKQVSLTNLRAALVGAVFASSRGGEAETDFGETSYADVGGQSSGYSPTETAVGTIVPVTGTLRNLFVDVRVNTLNTGSTVFTIMKNGIATAVTVTVNAGVTSITGDTTNTVAVTAGDRITLRAVSGGSSGFALYCFAFMVN